MPEPDFYNVAGVDPNAGAKIVYVWSRDLEGKYALLGSGHIVGATEARLPGISAGQFSVTFALRAGISPDAIAVTSDQSGKNFLAGITVTPCSTPSTSRSGGTITSDDPVIRVGASNGFPHLAGHNG